MFCRTLGIIAIALGLSGCGSSASYRYRMTVDVETPEGLKSGSAVQEQSASEHEGSLGDLSPKRGIRIRGEAVAVDLPGERTLFVLLPAPEAIQAALDPQWRNDWLASARRITNGETPQGPLQIYSGEGRNLQSDEFPLPTMVSFGDLQDPKSVKEARPDNLEPNFGSGVRLKRVSIQLTDDPVSHGLHKRLPWLSNYVSKQLSGDRFQKAGNGGKGISAYLSAGNFTTEASR